jgi:hypothetical protein
MLEYQLCIPLRSSAFPCLGYRRGPCPTPGAVTVSCHRLRGRPGIPEEPEEKR